MPVNVLCGRPFSGRVDRAGLRRIAQRALRAEKAPRGSSLTIIVVGDATITDYNRQFHHVKAPTDVLSFPSDERYYLGDIIISYETARENARAAHWRIRDELELLVVHGVLHLLGYEDSKPRARARMWKRQEEILGRRLGSYTRSA